MATFSSSDCTAVYMRDGHNDDNNYISDPVIRLANYEWCSRYYGLMKWALPTVPTGMITDATLIVQSLVNNLNAGELFLYFVRQPWIPDRVTWERYDGSRFWEEPGGLSGIDIYDQPISDATVTVDRTGIFSYTLNSYGCTQLSQFLNDGSWNGIIIGGYWDGSRQWMGGQWDDIIVLNNKPQLSFNYTI